MVKLFVEKELIDELDALSQRGGDIIRLTKIKKQKRVQNAKKNSKKKV